MAQTGDDNKKKKDTNAINQQKNQQERENAQHGKHTYSKEPDHL
ncbi:DUF3941 domain-containing protein [Halalkalibacter nanhaiisediminis]|uniref:Uncharacterized protein DUF3941 n=1 Tax=Halalkalibacter nanhaiisediminis TaxID=688079 RepID=A0A562QKB5_9BACI|nr:DUF3941 domain-containing protein [Halalkalibacter nanhaiisediminis]TWI57189.1 uncharacterized protein DUF3941 [Halalkalibacter nanhaiisediminis]